MPRRLATNTPEFFRISAPWKGIGSSHSTIPKQARPNERGWSNWVLRAERRTVIQRMKKWPSSNPGDSPKIWEVRSEITSAHPLFRVPGQSPARHSPTPLSAPARRPAHTAPTPSHYFVTHPAHLFPLSKMFHSHGHRRTTFCFPTDCTTCLRRPTHLIRRYGSNSRGRSYRHQTQF